MFNEDGEMDLVIFGLKFLSLLLVFCIVRYMRRKAGE